MSQKEKKRLDCNSCTANYANDIKIDFQYIDGLDVCVCNAAILGAEDRL